MSKLDCKFLYKTKLYCKSCICFINCYYYLFSFRTIFPVLLTKIQLQNFITLFFPCSFLELIACFSQINSIFRRKFIKLYNLSLILILVTNAKLYNLCISCRIFFFVRFSLQNLLYRTLQYREIYFIILGT